MNPETRDLIGRRRKELQAIPGSRFTPEHEAAAEVVIAKYENEGLPR